MAWMSSRSVAVGQSDQSRCSSAEGRAEFEALLERGSKTTRDESSFFEAVPRLLSRGSALAISYILRPQDSPSLPLSLSLSSSSSSSSLPHFSSLRRFVIDAIVAIFAPRCSSSSSSRSNRDVASSRVLTVARVDSGVEPVQERERADRYAARP